MTTRCARCEQDKPEDEFSPSVLRHGNTFPVQCKECRIQIRLVRHAPAMDWDCPTCGAPAGSWCHRQAGWNKPHLARRELARLSKELI